MRPGLDARKRRALIDAIVSDAIAPKSSSATRTLLVIDDNKSVRDSLRFLLQRRGYNVLLAESGAQGLALAGEGEVDGALIDLNMPGMHGLEACRLLREQAAARGRSIAVWMITGARTQELTAKSLEAGAHALLGKPFTSDNLFQLFDDTLGKFEPLPEAPDAPSAGGAALSPASGVAAPVLLPPMS